MFHQQDFPAKEGCDRQVNDESNSTNIGTFENNFNQ